MGSTPTTPKSPASRSDTCTATEEGVTAAPLVPVMPLIFSVAEGPTAAANPSTTDWPSDRSVALVTAGPPPPVTL